jgi:regulator of replication initiation timing
MKVDIVVIRLCQYISEMEQQLIQSSNNLHEGAKELRSVIGDLRRELRALRAENAELRAYNNKLLLFAKCNDCIECGKDLPSGSHPSSPKPERR